MAIINQLGISSYKPKSSKSTYTPPTSAGAGPYIPTYTPRYTPTRPNTGSNPTGLNTNASNLAGSNNIANAVGTPKTGGTLKSDVYTSSAGTSASTSLPSSSKPASSKPASSSGSKSYTPQGSISTAVVAGRADPVSSSNVNTNNSYYTVYDGTNRTAIDSKTGQVVGKASGAYNPPSNPPAGGGSDGSGGSGGSISSGGGDYSGSSGSSGSSSSMSQAEQQKEDIVQKLKDLLAEQEKKSKEAYETQLKEAYAKNKELWRSNADQINLNRARAERFSRNLYGEESGANNTNMARIGAGWASSHNQNNRNLASNDATALSNYNTNLSNAYNTLASGYSNFVLPVYTNRQNYLDELQYRRDANAMDYDYRRFLANAGLL